ncbi:MAG: hypothetical protein Q8P67_16410, partial [archaeon]|nr:hypothetical protein [archaeon]
MAVNPAEEEEAGFNWSWITGRDVEDELKALGSSIAISNDMINTHEHPLEPTSSWSSWLTTAKAKIYNIVSSYPQSLPVFSQGPIWMMGRLYRIPSLQDPTDYSLQSPYSLPSPSALLPPPSPASSSASAVPTPLVDSSTVSTLPIVSSSSSPTTTIDSTFLSSTSTPSTAILTQPQDLLSSSSSS